MDMLQTLFLGNTLQSWLIALGLGRWRHPRRPHSTRLSGTLPARLTKTRSNLDDLIVDKLEEPLVLALTIIALRTGYGQLSFGDGVDNFVDAAMKVAYALNITWGIARLGGRRHHELLRALHAAQESTMMDQFAPILRKGPALPIWVLGLIMALNNAAMTSAPCSPASASAVWPWPWRPRISCPTSSAASPSS